MADSPPTYLSPSELGSKDYWEAYYARTLAHLSQSQPPNSSSTITTTTTDITPNAPSTEIDDSDSASEVNDDDDPGTSWFSEHNAPQKVLRFLTSKSFPLSPRNTLRRRGHSSSPTLPHQPRILDLGTGNGSMLALLRKKGGFVGEMVGVDYSARSVQLARELQSARGHSAYHTDDEDESESDEDYDEGEDEEVGEEQDPNAAAKEETVLARPEPGKEATAEAVGISADTDENQTPQEIRFEEWDILGSTAQLSETGTPSSAPPPADQKLDWFPYETGGFDIVLDKGTFDAVSLSDDAKDTRVCERYPRIARRLVRAGGFVVVTSCNWTEEELVSWFVGGGHDQGGNDRLVVWGRVEYPRFRFGGHEGQGVSTVCFRRVVQ
ncbi:uncharacterized protein PFLUO_LOCUS6934 [Penicillium psychrofluorescens]|uniref:uncharacterized protein n=1 Tax=Penicillium psychrofluorescens TaxID=3158075 RepID=UPI003CCCCFF4